jgi:hypothetical protein
MRSKSDLRTRLGRSRPLEALEDEDTLSMDFATLRGSNEATHRHPKSGPVPRARAVPSARAAPPSEPAMPPPTVEQSRVREAIGRVERALARTAEDEDDRQRRTRTRQRRRGFMFGLATAGVGVLLGLGFGTLNERDKVAQLALSGAGQLIDELGHVEQEVGKISEALTGALAALDAGRFPVAEAKALSELEVPFDGASLAGRGIGRFKPAALTLLFEYTAHVTLVRAEQERLVGLLSVTRAGIERALEQKQSPSFEWAVFLQNESRGPVANLQKLPRSFRVNPPAGEHQLWPSEFEMNDERGRVTLQRYLGGDPLIAGQSVQLIPVSPETQGTVCPSDGPLVLKRELQQLQQLLAGDTTPGHELPSLVERGRALTRELDKIGRIQNVPSK